MQEEARWMPFSFIKLFSLLHYLLEQNEIEFQ